MKKRDELEVSVEDNPLARIFSALEISEADNDFMQSVRSASNVEYALAEGLVLKFLIREAKKRAYLIGKLESELSGLRAFYNSANRFRS